MCKPTSSTQIDSAFGEHVAVNGLSYGTKEEFEFRKSLFAESDRVIVESNANPDNTFVLGHNMFSTMTEDEKVKYHGLIPSQHRQGEIEVLEESPDVPNIDWRNKGALNPVKNQGQCGSCWAFSATAVMESHHFINTGKLLSLSEQQVVDCGNTCPDDKKTGLGCSGGDETCALEWLKVGQALESEYPYVGKDAQCDKGKFGPKSPVRTQKVVRVTPNHAPQLQAALARGPTTVAVWVDTSFSLYKSGVFNSASCAKAGDEHTPPVNHAIAAVGYGTESTAAGIQHYWIVRNSWGAGWGEQGYIRMEVTPGAGICNVQTQPSWAMTN